MSGNRKAYTGQVVSAKYNQFLTDKYGDSDRNILGYTLHVLIVEEGKRYCLEMQVYADSVIVDKATNKITYLHIVSPIYQKTVGELRAPIWGGDLCVGESTERVGISAVGDLKPKHKNNKDYVMGDLVTPFCVLKQPLITGTWWVEPNEDKAAVAIQPSAPTPFSEEEILELFEEQANFELANSVSLNAA